MRRILSYRLVLIALPLFYNSAQSQPDRFAYAVTAVNKGGSEWVALRKLDTRTGEFGSIILNITDKSPAINNSVAAIAYDRKANRIYYTPMNMDQLRYIDLATMKVFSVMEQFFSKAGNYTFQTADPITRMVIAPDDNGYTITNDGNHLIRFSTKEAPTLTDLGELQDDPLNKEMTIHNACANAGGDLVADDAGNLYLISASNRVYKIDITTRMTSYLATISGLPREFTTNGAAVDENGKLLVSSTAYADAYFIVDPKTWDALSSPTTHQIYGSADLANSNVLFSKTKLPSIIFLNRSPDNPAKITIFPNPVLFDEVSIKFDKLPPGIYTIQLANVLGRKVIQQKATITKRTQTEVMHLPAFTAQGLYYIRILDENNIVIGVQKLAVERW